MRDNWFMTNATIHFERLHALLFIGFIRASCVLAAAYEQNGHLIRQGVAISVKAVFIG